MITQQERSERMNIIRQSGQHLILTLESRYRDRELCSQFRPVISQKVDELCEKIIRAESMAEISEINHEFAYFVMKITGN